MSAEGRAAVIGAGIFGCAVALELARAGFAVSLFERRPEILTGATRNNLNRVHLGFHYPRHLGTARQSAAGYQPFVESFGDAVLGGFPNAYFVADEGSLTAPADYLAFCRRLGVPFEVIEPGTFEVAVRGCEAGIRCAEPVYDPGPSRPPARRAHCRRTRADPRPGRTDRRHRASGRRPRPAPRRRR